MSDEIAGVRQALAKFSSAADLFELRSFYDAAGLEMGEAERPDPREDRAGDRTGEWQGTEAEGKAAILYLHGGGFTIGSLASHRHIAGALAREAKGRSFAIDYRLAPEHPFPAALDDALAAYEHMLSQGVDPTHMAIAGDSAGGNLALLLLLKLRDLGRPLPACALLFSPWLDLEAKGESMVSKAAVDPVINRDASLATVPLITGGGDIRALGLAPLEADLSNLPPLLVQVGSHETLMDDATRLAAKAGAHDVSITLEIWTEMVHVWHFYYPMLSQGAAALERAGEFIRQHCG